MLYAIAYNMTTGTVQNYQLPVPVVGIGTHSAHLSLLTSLQVALPVQYS